MKLEVRRVNGEVWVKLGKDLAVVPICLLDEIRAEWAGKLADAVKDGKAVVNLWETAE